MDERVQADGPQASQVKVQDLERRGLDDHLVLVIVLETEGILAIAAVGRTTRRLHIRGAPGLRTNGPQEGGGVECSGTDFHVVRLQDHAATVGPVALQGNDQLLIRLRRWADYHSLKTHSKGQGVLGWRVYLGTCGPLSLLCPMPSA